jgi:hypothetical protein
MISRAEALRRAADEAALARLTPEQRRQARIDRAFAKLGPAERTLVLEGLCKVDAVAWVRARLGITPDDWQKELMRSTSDLAALCGRRVGKSQSAAWVAAHHVAESTAATALCISPTQRQSGELFRLAKAALDKALPDISFPTDNRLSLELPNRSRLLSLPGDPGTVRGLTASLVLLDEAQSLPDGGHELFAAVRPMLATTGGRMLVLGTPLDRSGLLFDLWEGGDAGRGAEGWHKIHVPSTLCPRIPASFLESERRLLGEALFRREYLAEFAAPALGMFDPELLAAALLPDDFVFNQGGLAMSTSIREAIHAQRQPASSTGAASRQGAIDTTGARYASAVLPT